MGMSAQHDLKACVCSLPVNLRRMREENGNHIVWNGGGHFLNIIGAIVVGIINASQLDALVAADNRHEFIEEQSNPHRFDFGDHPDRVVIAEHRVDRHLEVFAHAR